jgi:hypothetical protein
MGIVVAASSSVFLLKAPDLAIVQIVVKPLPGDYGCSGAGQQPE